MKRFAKLLIILSIIMYSGNSIAQNSCDEGFKCMTSISIFDGEPKYKNGFKHFDYVNPDAPKGGELKLGTMGTFDSLNPFIIKGNPAAGSSMIYDTLLQGSGDEIFTRYGLLAKQIKLSDDKYRIRFVLRDEAKWHDGKPITAADVVWTFNTLREKGSPVFQNYYRDVKEVREIAEKEVEFEFAVNNNRELPLIVGEFAILPKHFWEGKNFEESNLNVPLGSSKYKIDRVQAGKSISYVRVADYWGEKLPVNVGTGNFERMTYDYYRDETVLLEAFKAGQYDFRQENVAKNWATAYNIPAVKSGQIKLEEIKHSLSTGMQAFLLNLRKEKFQDVRVRKALTLAFDFEWANKNLFFDSYQRTTSYFSNSIYASKGKISEAEKKILEPFKDKLPAEIFAEEFTLPSTDGSGQNNQNLLKAKQLFEEAGWKIDGSGKLKNAKGEVFKIEFMLNSQAMQRLVVPYTKGLQRLGIETNIRMVDPAQYEIRMQKYNFDVVTHIFGSGMVPGNELIGYWNSKGADKDGGQNYPGVKNEVVDSLVDIIINAESQEELITACQALDRVLLWNYYMVPHFNLGKFRIAYWDKFGKPDVKPDYEIGTSTWWIKK
jgi:microcin C transport system substrate-binding protein